jgi:hypothetical protein
VLVTVYRSMFLFKELSSVRVGREDIALVDVNDNPDVRNLDSW